jgi:hypothetical protein
MTVHEMNNIKFSVCSSAFYFIYLRIGRIVNGRDTSETTVCSFLNYIEQIH